MVIGQNDNLGFGFTPQLKTSILIKMGLLLLPVKFHHKTFEALHSPSLERRFCPAIVLVSVSGESSSFSAV